MSREPANTGRPYQWLAVAVSLLIGASFLPLAWKVRLGSHGPFHLPVHFAAFAGCGLLAYASSEGFSSRVRRAAGLIVVGILLEVVQWRVFGNVFELQDLKADAGGAFLALLVSQFLAIRKPLTGRR